MLNNFFETIRVAERKAFSQMPLEACGQVVIGTDALPAKELVRFKSNYHLRFSSSSHTGVQVNEDQVTVILIDFLQLMGAEGVLPQHYTKLIISRIKQRDYAMADFMDMFHHRLISLFYRAWAKYRFVPQYEASRLANKIDPFTLIIDALTVNADKKSNYQRYYSGHFSKTVRSKLSLQSILSDFLKAPVSITEFVGDWLLVSDKNCSRLGSPAETSVCLGQGILLGRRVWNLQSKIKIHVESLSYEEYQKSMPGSECFTQLKQLICNFVQPHIRIDLIYNIKSKNQLSGFRDKPQLSRNSWLHSSLNSPLVGKITLR